ncbi:MAG: hypothetical protein U0325_09345 [Polyangiales bacterium]
MKTLAPALALTLVVGVAQPAAAQEVPHTASPWSVSVVLGPRYHLSGSRDAFSSETVGFAPGFVLSRDLLPGDARVELAAEVGFDVEANAGSLHQAWRTTVSSFSPFAGLALRVRALRWLLPYVRVHAGGVIHDVRLDPNDNSGVLEASAWGFQGTAGLGLMFQTGTFAREGAFRRVRLAFTLEGGAMYSTPVTLEAGPQAPSDARAAADRLPVPRVRLGDLDNSATYVRLGVGFRF